MWQRVNVSREGIFVVVVKGGRDFVKGGMDFVKRGEDFVKGEFIPTS